jgi:hydroxymethylpyrimidine/phosphomethylpyrimidine kinase
VTPPVALTIAGSDSGGGAGLQADLRAFASLGVFGASAVTAVTAQNTVGVDDVHVIPRDTVEAQLTAVLSDLPVAAVKTGMLATAELVRLVADRAAAGELPRLVVDPVLVSATGHQLLADDAVAVYRERLLPHALVVTPNLVEAGVLVGRELRDLDDARAAAEELAEDGPEVVVVKGGHGSGPRSVDIVVTRDGVHELSAERMSTANTHGTGCTFAAATAAGLARGADPLAALDLAKRYVTACIAGSVDWRLGQGCGPLDHLGFTPAGTPFGPEGWPSR